MESLLWPAGSGVPGGGPAPGTPPGAAELAIVSEETARDLELGAVVDWIARDRPDRRPYVERLLTHPPLHPELTRWRAEVCRDLLLDPRLCDGLEWAARELHHLALHRPEHFPAEVGKAARIGARLVELGAFLRTFEILRDALAGPVRAPALRALREDVRRALETPETAALR